MALLSCRRQITLALLIVSSSLFGADLNLNDSGYVLASYGWKNLSNNDATDWFDATPQGFQRTEFDSGWPATITLGGGYQFKSGLTVEGGVLLGPVRKFEFDYKVGSIVALDTSLEVSSYTYFGAVGHSYVYQGFSDSPVISFLGIRGGIGLLHGEAEAISPLTATSGSYEFDGNAPLFGFIVRSHWLLGGHFSIGTEVGWDFQRFENNVVSNAKGALSNVPSPDENNRGQRAYWDHSGFYVRINLAGWFSDPAKVIVSTNTAEDWRMVGNEHFRAGKKADAIRAYEKSLEKKYDRKLKEWLENYKGE